MYYREEGPTRPDTSQLQFELAATRGVMRAVLYAWLDYNAVTVFAYGRLGPLNFFQNHVQGNEPKGQGLFSTLALQVH